MTKANPSDAAADQSIYADNEITQDIDETQVDLSLSWQPLTPKFATEEEKADAPLIFYDRDEEAVCEVEKVEGKKGQIKFRNKETKGENIYYGTQRSVASVPAASVRWCSTCARKMHTDALSWDA